MTNESIKEGPAPGRAASPAAAVPTVANMPAPMIAPMPSSVTLNAPRVRLNENCGPPMDARMSSRFFVRKSPRSKGSPPKSNEIGLALAGACWADGNCVRSLAWNAAENPEEKPHQGKGERVRGKQHVLFPFTLYPFPCWYLPPQVFSC